MLIKLNNAEVHVWLCDLEKAKRTDAWALYLAELQTQELKRLNAYKFEVDKDRYLLRRVLLRWVLSLYVQVSPRDLRFQLNDFGKPKLAVSPITRPLHFNLSFSGQKAILAISRSPLGVDIEKVNSDISTLHLASFAFSDIESKYLRDLPESHFRQAFFELWTLKESYIKALGKGLSIPLQDFSFTLDTKRIKFASRLECGSDGNVDSSLNSRLDSLLDGSLNSSLDESLDGNMQDVSTCWNFTQGVLDKDYYLALCTHSKPRLTAYSCTPFQDFEEVTLPLTRTSL